MRLIKSIELCNEFEEVMSTVEVVAAESLDDANAIGIHLLYPTARELDDAVEQAARDNFNRIVIHNQRTFAKGARK